MARFKNIKSVTARIMYNKKKRESDENVMYSRFVLSSVRVKEKLLSQEDLRGKQKQRPGKSPATDPRETEDREEDHEDEEDGEIENDKKSKGKDTKATSKEPKEKNKVGYAGFNYTVCPR